VQHQIDVLVQPSGDGSTLQIEGTLAGEAQVDDSGVVSGSSSAGLGRALDFIDWTRRAPLARRRGWLIRRLLLLADMLGFTLAVLVAQQAGASAWYVLSLPLWIVLARLYGLYNGDEDRAHTSTVDDVAGIFHVFTIGAFTLLAGSLLAGGTDVEALVVLWSIAIPAVVGSRIGARALARRSPAYLQNTVIVGAGDVGQLIARKILQHPEFGMNVVGFVDTQPKERRPDLGHLTLLGGPDELSSLIRAYDVGRVVIAFSNDGHEELLTLMRELKDLDVQVDVVPRLFELVGPSVNVHMIEGVPLLSLSPPQLPRSSRLLKRTMELFLAIPGTILLLPVLALVALAIKLDSPGPIFFRQVRMGARGSFKIWKFRTMVADADARKDQFAHLNRHLAPGRDPRMFKIENDPRVTRVGRFLRRYSIDELPQLFNVLRGEMSLVGPRPLILSEDEYIEGWGRRRLDLKPGITGPWQVLGRNEIPFGEMVRLDYLYVTGWTLGTDLKLLLQTIPIMFRRGGIY
jgi:exopolysaccharide biosynthesis polyprenyl glycosylphosphotransferase